MDFAISLTRGADPKNHHFVLSKDLKDMNTTFPITLCIRFWRKRQHGGESSQKSVLMEIVPIASNSGIKNQFSGSLFFVKDELFFHWFDKSIKVLSGLPYERWYPICIVIESDSDIMQVYHKEYSADQNFEIVAQNVTTGNSI